MLISPFCWFLCLLICSCIVCCSIPIGLNGEMDCYAAEIHQRELPGAATTHKLISSNPSAEELESLVNPGTVLDAFLSLEPYDYQQRAGIRLVARKLVIH